jgi:LacI family transcriptional regulator
MKRKSWFYPQLCFELGKLAAKLFIETVHQDKDMSDVDEVLKTKLFVRESSQRLTPKINRFK